MRHCAGYCPPGACSSTPRGAGDPSASTPARPVGRVQLRAPCPRGGARRRSACGLRRDSFNAGLAAWFHAVRVGCDPAASTRGAAPGSTQGARAATPRLQRGARRRAWHAPHQGCATSRQLGLCAWFHAGRVDCDAAAATRGSAPGSTRAAWTATRRLQRGARRLAPSKARGPRRDGCNAGRVRLDAAAATRGSAQRLTWATPEVRRESAARAPRLVPRGVRGLRRGGCNAGLAAGFHGRHVGRDAAASTQGAAPGSTQGAWAATRRLQRGALRLVPREASGPRRGGRNLELAAGFHAGRVGRDAAASPQGAAPGSTQGAWAAARRLQRGALRLVPREASGPRRGGCNLELAAGFHAGRVGRDAVAATRGSAPRPAHARPGGAP
ncbi:MAG: hypothetical protein RL653_2482 [Pseudomonadota bacterium]